MGFAVEALVLQQCVRVTNSGDSGKNCKGAVYVLQRKIRDRRQTHTLSLILDPPRLVNSQCPCSMIANSRNKHHTTYLTLSLFSDREQQEQTPVLDN